VHPGSGGKRKCWPAQRFAELAARLRAPVLLLEGPADADACREFAEALASSVPAARVTGVSLSRLAALLSESRGYMGNDSGVSHLAAALGVPTIAVFGPTDPAVWAPLGPEVSVVTTRGDAPWPTVDDVIAAAGKLFDNRARGAAA
jgi:ADP-heptose:LPS heptosyltransferase